MITADGSRPAAARSVSTSSTRCGVEVPTVGRAVDEHRMRPDVCDGRGARDEGKGWDEHLVSGSTPANRRARCSAAVPLDRATACATPVLSATSRSKASMSGPDGRDPVGVERLEEHLPFFSSPTSGGDRKTRVMQSPRRYRSIRRRGLRHRDDQRHHQVDAQGHTHGCMA